MQSEIKEVHVHECDQSSLLQAQVQAALASGTPLVLKGGGSKDFLGRKPDVEHPVQTLETSGHTGIVSYDPAELVITARAGTRVQDLVQTLAAEGQILACEPPVFEGKATVGGMVAAGISGPRRPWAGSVRDFVLGCRLITGIGQHLRFGGEVIKNVAGYDVSRLMAGSMGCLGVLTEVSLKVLPRPRTSASLRLPLTRAAALARLAEWGRQALPISGACHDGEGLMLRLEGGEGSVASAQALLGGEPAPALFWEALREQQLDFFRDPRPLWRLSVAASRVPSSLPGEVLLDWGGAQIWLKSDAEATRIRALAVEAGGHASCWTPETTDSPFEPLPEALMRYHRQLKARLDPQGIFNPGRMYAGL